MLLSRGTAMSDFKGGRWACYTVAASVFALAPLFLGLHNRAVIATSQASLYTSSAVPRVEQHVRYGFLSDDRTSVEYWDDKRVSEEFKCPSTDSVDDCLGTRFLAAYNELTRKHRAFVDDVRTAVSALDLPTLKNPPTNVEPSADIPSDESRRAIPLVRAFDIPKQKELLQRCLDRATYRNAEGWSLCDVPLHAKGLVITPRLSGLPVHRIGRGVKLSTPDSIVFERY